jgi:hypothetical protein
MLLEGKKVCDVAWTDKKRYYFYDKMSDTINDESDDYVSCTLASFFDSYAGDMQWEEWIPPKKWNWKAGDRFDCDKLSMLGRYFVVFANDKICLAEFEGCNKYQLFTSQSNDFEFMSKVGKIQ